MVIGSTRAHGSKPPTPRIYRIYSTGLRARCQGNLYPTRTFEHALFRGPSALHTRANVRDCRTTAVVEKGPMNVEWLARLTQHWTGSCHSAGLLFIFAIALQTACRAKAPPEPPPPPPGMASAAQLVPWLRGVREPVGIVFARGGRAWAGVPLSRKAGACSSPGTDPRDKSLRGYFRSGSRPTARAGAPGAGLAPAVRRKRPIVF